MLCPGQDMRYWKGNVAFEIACPKCAAAVEFFKDESSRRCRRCGHLFPNPKISLDCARWCDYAEKCLGIAPDMKRQTAVPDSAFAVRILSTAEELFGDFETAGSPTLLVFQHARELVSSETCNPRLVLATALMIELESRTLSASAGVRPGQSAPPNNRPSTEDLLAQFRMDEIDIQGVCEILQRFRREAVPIDIETRIVCDAVALAKLTLDNSRGELDQLDPRLDELKTQAGRERARSLFDG